ncbi:MAG TPA: STAS domain-containing protein [Nocardioidaceae bacterium]|nr:STAS domain-containing protein [Nocardioidaceae bacterium]
MVAQASRVDVSVLDGVAVVAARGEFDLMSSDRLRGELEHAATELCARVVLDLAEVTFLDSSCIGALIRAARTAEGAGGSLHLAAARDNVRRVLEVTEVGDYLGLYPDVAAAIRASNSRG